MSTDDRNETQNKISAKTKSGFSSWLPFKLVLALCTSLIFIGSFTDAIDKIISFAEKYSLLPNPQIQSNKLDITEQKSNDHSAPFVQAPTTPQPIDAKVLIGQSGNSAEKNSTRTDEQILAVSNSAQSLPVRKMIDSNPEAPKDAATYPDASLQTIETSTKSSGAIRTALQAPISALSNSTKVDRYSLLSSLSPNLPDDLNAEEISALLGKESLSDRRILLGLTLSKTKKRSLPADQLDTIFDEQIGYANTEIIQMLAPYIKTPLTPIDASNLLKNISDSDRLKTIMKLNPLIRKPVASTEMDLLLGNLSGWHRNQATLFLMKPQ